MASSGLIPWACLLPCCSATAVQLCITAFEHLQQRQQNEGQDSCPWRSTIVTVTQCGWHSCVIHPRTKETQGQVLVRSHMKESVNRKLIEIMQEICGAKMNWGHQCVQPGSKATGPVFGG